MVVVGKHFDIYAWCGLVGKPHGTARISKFAPLPTPAKPMSFSERVPVFVRGQRRNRFSTPRELPAYLSVIVPSPPLKMDLGRGLSRGFPLVVLMGKTKLSCSVAPFCTFFCMAAPQKIVFPKKGSLFFQGH